MKEFGALNKQELVAAVAARCGLSKKDTEAMLNAALDAITASLKEGERVQLMGFGTFEVKHRAARTGRNPRTKEAIEIPEANVVSFKAGKALKDSL